MNILFVVYTSGGNGGHYRSLITLCNLLSPHHSVEIVNIGRFESPVIMQSQIRHSFAFFNKRNWNSVSKSLRLVITSHKIDVVHAFDYFSYDAAFFCASKIGIPVVLTKCGGPAPQIPALYPPIENLIVFSKEDKIFFKKRKGYKTITHIPNRALPYELNNDAIAELRSILKLDNKFVVLRIGRISHAYYSTIKQAIRLTSVLRKYGLDAEVIILGSVDNEDVLKELEDAKNRKPFIHIITEDRYTKDAKSIIGVADAVVGTGRGFMEACFQNKIMYAPVANSEFPAPVSDENIEDILGYNFSERYISKTRITEEQLYQNAISEPHSESWFKKYFDINSALPVYQRVYQSLYNSRYYFFTRVIVSRLLISLSSFKTVRLLVK